MAKQRGETSYGRRLHLEVTDLHTVVFESLNLLVLLGVGDVCTEYAPLRTIESAARDGVTSHHIVLSYLVDELFICQSHIRCALDGIPLHVFCKSLLHINIAHHITTSIIVQQTVEADTLHGSYKATRWREWLQSTASSDAYHRQRAVLFFLLAGVIVDVGERVKFVDHDIYVIAANTVTLNRDALALIGASNGVELTTADLALFRVEVGCNGVNTGRITHQNYLVGQLFRLQMKVKTRTIGIDNQF